MKAYKGFNPDMKCRDFQYVEGETYEQKAAAKLCRTGFHAVLQPLDVFSYYPPASSVYHEVDLDEVDEKRESDSKVAGRKIKIGVGLGIPGLVAAQIEFVMSNVDKKAKPGEHTTTARSAASSTGDQSAASSTGYQSAASSTGYQSAASSTGYQSAASSTGAESIAAVFGYDGKARGAEGNWIVLTERDTSYHILGVKAVLVDGTKVKADTYYSLRRGKVVAAK
ncbi:MAG TPA: hypothetical protein VN108_00950 [Marmoricola sp.]|nr:hypothetical protein [Marmoricola sp.]